jgi:hypothetical protein
VVLVLTLAVSWNVSPLATAVAQGTDDPAAHASYWRPAIDFLHHHLSPSYRVEVVDTTGHWPALYFPEAGIPIVRGWFRQNDFPQNELLYDPLGREAYLGWLRALGVRYVVVSAATPDYSAQRERRLVESKESGLQRVFTSPDLAVYEVPSPRAILSGPGRPTVLALQETRLLAALDRRGTYRIAIRYSPYWEPTRGCVSESADGMIRLRVARPGVVSLRFVVDAEHAVKAIAGVGGSDCAEDSGAG